VDIFSSSHESLGLGLCNYSCNDLKKIMGKNGTEVVQILGADAKSLAVIEQYNLACNQD